MSLNFTPAQVRIQSMIKETGLFPAGVTLFEPTSAVGPGLFCAIFLDEITPVPQESGQNVTTGRAVFKARVLLPMPRKSEAATDQNIGLAVGKIMELMSGDIELQDTVKYVDLLGATGTPLSAKGGYLTLDQTLYRLMDVTIPLIINDVWNQGTS